MPRQEWSLKEFSRRKELADLSADIANIRYRYDNERDFEMKLAYKKLLIILREWKRRGIN